MISCLLNTLLVSNSQRDDEINEIKSLKYPLAGTTWEKFELNLDKSQTKTTNSIQYQNTLRKLFKDPFDILKDSLKIGLRL